jgi:hypothetical protein
MDLERSRVHQFHCRPSGVSTNLSSLCLNLCKVEDESLLALSDQLFNLSELRLNGCSLVTDASLLRLATHASKMRTLQLHSLYRITDTAVSGILRGMPLLETLELRNCKSLTWGGLASAFDSARLQAPLALRRLDLSKAGAPSKESDQSEWSAKNQFLTTVARVLGNQLEAIELAECNFPDQGISLLLESFASRLKWIDLSDCGDLSDSSVATLCTRSPNVERLKLNSCRKLKYEQSILCIADSLRKVRTIFLGAFLIGTNESPFS